MCDSMQNVIMLSLISLSVIMLSFIMLSHVERTSELSFSVFTLSVITSSVVILRAVAPLYELLTSPLPYLFLYNMVRVIGGRDPINSL